MRPGQRYPLMRPDRATLLKWVNDYRRHLRARPPKPGKATRGSVSLLSHLQYTASERDQGQCSNCWAWAGTGCLEIALDTQESVKDRLSVQYVNSCETSLIGKTRCDGGWLSDLVDFYDATKMAIPWSNTNADWTDGDLSYGTTCSVIATSPNYEIDSIDYASLSTQTVSQATAIANIKAALDDGDAVWFAFFLPNDTAWNDFFDFWDDNDESTAFDINQYGGVPYNFLTGAGHAILCVGYDDTDPDNSYWIMLNSWGTTTSRTNGLLRINMDMNYDAQNSSYYSFYWQTLDAEFAETTSTLSLTDRSSGSTTITDERTVSYSITTSGSPTQMMFSENADFSGASWQTYAASGTFTLSDGYGAKTVYFKLKINSQETTAVSAGITYSNSAAPVVSQFVIKNSTSGSSSYTNSRSVSVTASADNASEMIISENSDFALANWQTYDSAFTFSLTPTDGEKTVYYKVRNVFGTESATQTATIILDTTAPVLKLKADNNLLQSNDLIKTSFLLNGVITDLCPIDTGSLKIYLDSGLVSNGIDASGRYDSYDAVSKTVSYQLKSELSSAAHTVKIEAADLAGNTGSCELTNLRVSENLQLDNLVNFPNPFSSSTKISYQLSQPADITIKIYSIKGKLLKSFSIAKNSAGGQTGFNYVIWTGTDEAGLDLPNDAYLYLVIAVDGNDRIAKKGRLAILR